MTWPELSPALPAYHIDSLPCVSFLAKLPQTQGATNGSLKDHMAARRENPGHSSSGKAQLPPGAFIFFHACEFSDAA